MSACQQRISGLRAQEPWGSPDPYRLGGGVVVVAGFAEVVGFFAGVFESVPGFTVFFFAAGFFGAGSVSSTIIFFGGGGGTTALRLLTCPRKRVSSHI